MFGHGLSELRLRPTRRLALTALEERCVPAVTATFVSHQLSVTGDNGDQNLTITQTGAGAYRVDGLTAGSQTFTGVNYIAVNTKGGSDQVRLVGASGQIALLYGATVTGTGALTVVDDKFNINVSNGSLTVMDTGSANVSVSVLDGTTLGDGFSVTTGAGSDSVTIGSGVFVGGRTLLRLGAGTNSTTINAATLDGALTVAGGTGRDTVTLTGTMIGLFNPGSIDLNLGGGTDTVTVAGLNVTGTGYGAGNGSITSTNGTVAIDLKNANFQGYLDCGGREANAVFTNCTFGDRLRVTTTAGNDVVETHGCRIGGLFSAQTGTGVDRVTVENTTVGANATVAGSGVVSFTATGSTFQGGLVVDYHTAPAAAPATIKLDQTTVKGDLAITTGAGADTVTLHGVTVGQANTPSATTILTGGGNDLVDLGSSIFNSTVRLDGGAGSERLLKSGAQFRRQPPVILNFETIS
jgi:hypothetical protein